MKAIKMFALTGISVLFLQCAEMQSVATQLPGVINAAGIGNVSNQQISMGLKEALDLGIQQGITSLGKTNGFFNNSLVKIALPQELQQVDATLRKVGLGALSDEGIKLLNRAAEDAVSSAAPIFTSALQQMTFTDAKNILFGGKNAATLYLQNTTTTQLVNAFEPKVSASLGKVGADKAWNNIITKYNSLTGKSVNPDLNSYVTEQAINGVFKMVAQKETDIRTHVSSRTTTLLQQVFALQDTK